MQFTYLFWFQCWYHSVSKPDICTTLGQSVSTSLRNKTCQKGPPKYNILFCIHISSSSSYGREQCDLRVWSLFRSAGARLGSSSSTWSSRAAGLLLLLLPCLGVVQGVCLHPPPAATWDAIALWIGNPSMVEIWALQKSLVGNLRSNGLKQAR